MAAGFTTVSAAHLQDATGTVIAKATIYFLPVSPSTGRPISFRAGGALGATVAVAVSAVVAAGAFNIQLADTTLTLPVNIGYKVTVLDNVTGDSLLGPGYGCVQPSGSTWSLDSYQPNLAAEVAVQYGPEGPAGSLSIASVEVGDTAAVVNTGTNSAAVLNITLPRGLQGVPGVNATAGTLTGNFSSAPVAGTIDGSNRVFTVSGSESAFWFVFRNGVRLFSGRDYTQSGNSLTLAVAPDPNGLGPGVPDIIYVDASAPVQSGSGGSGASGTAAITGGTITGAVITPAQLIIGNDQGQYFVLSFKANGSGGQDLVYTPYTG